MSWTFCTSDGGLYYRDELQTRGYSGHADGRNNSAMESVRGVGPVPRGEWKVAGPPFTSKATGPYALRLIPKYGTNTFGRDLFEMHGDSAEHPGEASHGCIVVCMAARRALWESGEHDLTVTDVPPADDDQTPSIS